jgi:formylmethanofuran dehydrogenase subunit E
MLTAAARQERAGSELAALAETVLGPYLEPLSQLHRVLCPRQVLGVRIALLASRWLDVPFPQADKRTLILTEIDGCFTDGLSVVSGCSLGHRTLRLLDHGKIAATIVDTRSMRAVRICPQPTIRAAACAYADGERRRWHAQRLGYARMPDAELLLARAVDPPCEIEPLLASWHTRTECVRCGEEILNARQLRVDDNDLCRGCAKGGSGDASGR